MIGFPVFAKAEDVPEAFKSAYVEKEGKWVAAEEDVAGLKSALAKTKREADALKEKLSGIDVDKYSELVKAEKELELKKLAAAGEIEKLQAKYEADIVKHKTEGEAALAAVTSKYHGTLVRGQLRTFAIEGGVIPTDVEDVLNLTQHQFRLDPETEKVFMVDEKGERTTMGGKQYFAEDYKKARPKFYLALDAEGGAHGDFTKGADGVGVVTLSRSDAADIDKYRAAKTRADKEGHELRVAPYTSP